VGGGGWGGGGGGGGGGGVLLGYNSYAWVRASLARYKNATVAGYFLELLLTWFKKYHLLFSNYTSACISTFNCLY